MVMEAVQPDLFPAAPAVERVRLFIGLWPDTALRAAIAAHQRRWRWPAGLRPTRPERLHLTLHFLGEPPRDCVEPLQRLLARCAPGGRIGRLRLDRTTVWTGGTAVLTPSDPPPGLFALHTRLGDALRGVGLHAVPTASWQPHVTLARKADGAEPPPWTEPLDWEPDGCVLVESELRPPARYRVIGRWGSPR